VTAIRSTYAGDIFVYIDRQAKYHCCQVHTTISFDDFCVRILSQTLAPEVLNHPPLAPSMCSVSHVASPVIICDGIWILL